jgi:hypothetical protein
VDKDIIVILKIGSNQNNRDILKVSKTYILPKEVPIDRNV